MKHYLVTGGAGFIGGHLVDRLLRDGHQVTILDNFSLTTETDIARLKDNPNCAIIRASICDDLSPIFKANQFDGVFHFAALPRVQFSIKQPRETHEANLNGTLNLLIACKEFGVKRFVFSCSSSVYGDQPTLPLTEDMKPNPMSPYALHKLTGEYYCKLFHNLYGIETVSLRYFNVFGPRQNPNGDYATLIPKFTMMIHAGQQPKINGDGEQTRDFTFVDDIVEANMRAMTTDNAKCFGEMFNVGYGKGVSVNRVAEYINELCHSSVEPIHGPAVIEPKNTSASTAKIQNAFGWAPEVSFEEGMKKTFAFFVP